MTTAEKLENAKAAWREAKAKAGASKSSPEYFAEVTACCLVIDLQDQLERERKEAKEQP